MIRQSVRQSVNRLKHHDATFRFSPHPMVLAQPPVSLSSLPPLLLALCVSDTGSDRACAPQGLSAWAPGPHPGSRCVTSSFWTSPFTLLCLGFPVCKEGLLGRVGESIWLFTGHRDSFYWCPLSPLEFHSSSAALVGSIQTKAACGLPGSMPQSAAQRVTM